MNKYWHRKSHPYNIYYVEHDCVWYYKLWTTRYSSQHRGYISNCTIKQGFNIPGSSEFPIDKSAIPFNLELIWEINDKYDIPKDMLKDMLEELVK